MYDRSLQALARKPPEPYLDVPAALEALLPAVEGVVAASGRGAHNAKRLAAELLRFLHLKVAINDVGPVYLLAPPPLIDAAWRALLLETAVLSEVHAALGVGVIHHSAHQPGGDAAHAARLRATFSAAAHVAEQSGQAPPVTAAPTCPAPAPDALFWGVPERSDFLVRVMLLPLAAAHPCPVQHAYMPLQSTVSDLAAQLQCMYGDTLERFRPLGPAEEPLHPAKLLRCVDASSCSRGGSGSCAGSAVGNCTLQLFATSATAGSSLSRRPPSLAMQDRVSLNVNLHNYTDLDGRAPLGSLLAARKFTCGGSSSTALTYFYLALPQQGRLVLDETWPLANFDGAQLQTSDVAAPTVDLPLTVRFDACKWAVRATLPEAWTLADLTNWTQRFGAKTLYVDGAPAPPGLSHASHFTCVDVVDAEDGAAADGGAERYEVFVRTLMGTTVVIHVKRCWKVLRAKYLVEDKTGIPHHQQRLIFSGKQLEDDRTLGAFNVDLHATLHVLLYLRGC